MYSQISLALFTSERTLNGPCKNNRHLNSGHFNSIIPSRASVLDFTLNYAWNNFLNRKYCLKQHSISQEISFSFQFSVVSSNRKTDISSEKSARTSSSESIRTHTIYPAPQLHTVSLYYQQFLINKTFNMFNSSSIRTYKKPLLPSAHGIYHGRQCYRFIKIS